MTAPTRPVSKFQLPRNLRELYGEYSWQGTVPSPAFAYRDTAEWASLTEHVQGVLDSDLSGVSADRRLLAQERENIAKMSVCWRLTGYGELYEPDSDAFSTRNAEQASLLTAAFRKRRKQYMAWLQSKTDAQLREILDSAPVRLDKGKGAPYWSPGSDRAVTLAYGRLAQDCRTYAQLERMVQSAGNAAMRFVQTSYIRVQGARKPRKVWTPGTDNLVDGGEARMPKVRRIGAMPFAVNHLMAAVGALLRTAMASIDERNRGDISAAAQAVSQSRYSAALDFASFDTTVALETLEMVDQELLFPVLDMLMARGLISPRERDLLADCAYHINYMAILLPPRYRYEAAYLVSAEGQTRSGIQLTSWYGTEINGRFIDTVLMQLGADERTKVFNYGDDTIMATDDAALIDRWADEPNRAGFNTTVAPDATYLMKRLPYGYSYLGRMAAASINREPQHEPKSTIAAAAAFATRHALLSGHPLQSSYLKSLQTWQRGPKRMQRAVALAVRGRNDPVRLAWLASLYTLANNPNANTESIEQMVSNLAATGAPGASAVKERLAGLLIHHKRAMPWRTFQRAAADISLADAERMIKQRSYTIPRST